MKVIALILLSTILLSACGMIVPTNGLASTQVDSTHTDLPFNGKATPTIPQATKPGQPAVGGTLVYAINQEPVTLDAQIEPDDTIMNFLGSTLVAFSPEGKYVPYLAQDWQTSVDGLTWTFHLKSGVKFHDGVPLTARDFVWTFKRALALDPQASFAGAFLGPIKSVDAPDEYTLRLVFKEPFYPLLYNLSTAWTQPLEQAAVERWGNDYGKHPVGVGPLKFKEWKAGEKIIFERNPDFTWGPYFTHPGPWYIGGLEFRVIPEYMTSIAGLEAGAVDYFPNLQANDFSLIQDTRGFQVFESLAQGLDPMVIFNSGKPPFDDIRVRQAFNLAVNRELIIQVVTLGNAVPQNGPLSPTQHGYWPGAEQIGYRYHPDQARALMAQAGYVPGKDGILVRDGKPLKVTLETVNIERYIKTCEILQEELRALGVDLQIAAKEQSTIDQNLIAGDFKMSVGRTTHPEADHMYIIFSTNSFNLGKVDDPILQDMLNKTRSTIDPALRQR